ncbi:MAG: cytochrome C oxidase subunit IV family protein [Acidimicrobiia bacterium]
MSSMSPESGAANTKLKSEAHPSEKTYVKIALILAVLTAAEVATYPSEDALGSAVIPILLVLMVIKFWYVAAFFMHLKFDTKLFSSVFVAGLVASCAVYIGALASFEFWSSGYLS